MKQTFAYLCTTTFLAFVAAGFAANAATESKVEYKENGGYESTKSSEHKAPDGTTHTTESNVDVDVDKNGRVSKLIETESSTDPKGLLNEKKDIAKTEREEKPRGGYKETVTRQHRDADGTDITARTTTDVNVDKQGNVTQIVRVEKIVNPTGLMNETKTVNVTKTVNGKLVEQKTDVN